MTKDNKPNHSKSESQGIVGTMAIPTAKILSDEKFNARGSLDGEHTIEELAESIRRDGLLQPIMVWEHGGEYKSKLPYVTIYGFRREAAIRFLAAKYPKDVRWNEVRAQVWKGTEKDALLLNLTENTAREDLRPWEIAKRAIELSERFEMTGSEIGNRIGRSKTYADNLMRNLRNLPTLIIDEWKKGNALATTNNLNRWSAYKVNDEKDGPPDHKKMLQKWNEACGGAKVLEDGVGDGEESDGESNGHGEAQAGKLKRPSKAKIAECLAACKRAVKQEKRSADWGKGAREMLAFMTGQRDSIIGVYSPRVASKPDLDAELEE